MFIMVPIVFLVNGFTKGDWVGAFLFAVSVAVGLTPEMLPMIVSGNLAKGAYEMPKKKTVVKSLSAIQNFGAMDILCTDKTGTLTEDKIIVERYLDINGHEDRRVLRHAYLNSYYQTGLKNLMDVAILSHGDEHGLQDIEKNYTKEITEQIINMTTQLNREGMRVIAVAQKNHTEGISSFGVKDESNMVLMGYIGFLDSPKASTAGAIRALYDHGVEVKVLTGDNEFVTMNICKNILK